MNKKKLVKLIFTIAFFGATGIFYSCNRSGEETNVVFNTKDKELENTSKPVASDAMQATSEPVTTPTEQPSKKAGFVYLCGAVVKPEVYEFTPGERVVDVVKAAGGFTKDAAKDMVNLARELVDGEQIYIPTMEEVKSENVTNKDVTTGNTLDSSVDTGKINLNTATVEELNTLPGIGEAKAKNIVKYREANGAFSSIEDIMKIEGIKAGVFDKIQEYITVK